MVESSNGFQEASCACLVPRNADAVSEDVAIKGCPLVGGNRGRGGGGRGWRLRPAGLVGFGAGHRCDNQRRNDGRADPHRGCGGHAGRRRRFRAIVMRKAFFSSPGMIEFEMSVQITLL